MFSDSIVSVELGSPHETVGIVNHRGFGADRLDDDHSAAYAESTLRCDDILRGFIVRRLLSAAVGLVWRDCESPREREAVDGHGGKS